MRLMLKCIIVVGLSTVVFLVIQWLFDGVHCFDCGTRYGFPLSYMQDGTYATHGHILWMGFLGDLALAATVSLFAVWVWLRKVRSK